MSSSASHNQYFTHSTLPVSLHLRVPANHALPDSEESPQHTDQGAALSIYVNTVPHAFCKHIYEPLHNIPPEQLFQILKQEPITLSPEGNVLHVSLLIPKYASLDIAVPLDTMHQKPRVGFVYDERMLLHKNEKIFIYEEVKREREAKLQWVKQMEHEHRVNTAEVGNILSMNLAEDDDDEDDDASFDPEATNANGTTNHHAEHTEPHNAQQDSNNNHATNLPPPENNELSDYDDYDDEQRSPSPEEEAFHPECPERLPAVIDMMNQEGLLPKCARINARDATDEELTLVHSPEYVRGVREYVSSQGKVPLNYDRGDVYLNEYSGQAASLACGSVVEITEQVVQGNIDRGVAVVRSPGHHAERDRATGFCFYSNVAIAAKTMKKRYGLKRILIVDWDVHAGNGTQHAVEDDPDILFFSVHRAPPYYPGHTGFISEVGLGKAKGYTINVPFYKPYGDAELLAAFHTVLLPVAHNFNPQLVLVSAGFDAVKGDPIGQCFVSPSTYGTLTAMLKPLAGGKIVLALEGGYNHQQTARSFTECLRVLLGEDAKYNPVLGVPSTMCREVLHAVRQLHAPYWPQCFWDTADAIFEPDMDEDLDEESVASTAQHHVSGEKRPRSSSSPHHDTNTPRKRRRADSSSDLDDMSGEALTRMGEHYLNSGDYETAYLIFEKAKEKDCLDAQFHLAEMHYTGRGVPKNLQEARLMFEAGAHLGHAGCKVSLAAMYAQGEIPHGNLRQAVEWYESAAFEDNHPVAFRNLGYCYKIGVGVKKDLKKALELFLKASDLGNTQAMVSLGCMYMEGNDVVKKNYEAGKQYFEMAADNDDDDGWYNLGLCYEYGYACKMNAEKAMECFTRALELNNKNQAAKEKVERLLDEEEGKR